VDAPASTAGCGTRIPRPLDRLPNFFRTEQRFAAALGKLVSPGGHRGFARLSQFLWTNPSSARVQFIGTELTPVGMVLTSVGTCVTF